MATGSIVNAFADFTTQASFPVPAAGDMRMYFKTSDTLPYFKNPAGTESAFAVLTAGVVPLSLGGTNAALTANVGGIVYSAASALAILNGTATAGQIIRSGASAAPSWSTATYPATAGTAANVLRSDGTNFLSAALAAADLSNGVTGSGAVMLTASPSTTGTLTAAAINASGAITSTISGISFDYNSAGTALKQGLRVATTGGNTGVFTENSAGNTWSGSSPYASVLGSQANASTHILANNAIVATFASGGAVTIPGTGPHAIGGTTQVDSQLLMNGAYSGTVNAWGLNLQQTLTVPVNGSAATLILAGTINKQSAGTHPDFSSLYLYAPTIGAGAGTLTNTSTLAIDGAPATGTNKRAVWVKAGLSQFDGAVLTTSTLTFTDATLHRTATTLTNGAAAQIATMTNGPSAGNPTKWAPVDDNGTTRYIPMW